MITIDSIDSYRVPAHSVLNSYTNTNFQIQQIYLLPDKLEQTICFSPQMRQLMEAALLLTHSLKWVLLDFHLPL